MYVLVQERRLCGLIFFKLWWFRCYWRHAELVMNVLLQKIGLIFQAMTGGGGWPMSVWLTPQLKPFVGATYFPLEDQPGRPGFRTILNLIDKQVCFIDCC